MGCRIIYIYIYIALSAVTRTASQLLGVGPLVCSVVGACHAPCGVCPPPTKGDEPGVRQLADTRARSQLNWPRTWGTGRVACRLSPQRWAQDVHCCGQLPSPLPPNVLHTCPHPRQRSAVAQGMQGALLQSRRGPIDPTLSPGRARRCDVAMASAPTARHGKPVHTPTDLTSPSCQRSPAKGATRASQPGGAGWAGRGCWHHRLRPPVDLTASLRWVGGCWRPWIENTAGGVPCTHTGGLIAQGPRTQGRSDDVWGS